MFRFVLGLCASTMLLTLGVEALATTRYVVINDGSPGTTLTAAVTGRLLAAGHLNGGVSERRIKRVVAKIRHEVERVQRNPVLQDRLPLQDRNVVRRLLADPMASAMIGPIAAEIELSGGRWGIVGSPGTILETGWFDEDGVCRLPFIAVHKDAGDPPTAIERDSIMCVIRVVEPISIPPPSNGDEDHGASIHDEADGLASSHSSGEVASPADWLNSEHTHTYIETDFWRPNDYRCGRRDYDNYCSSPNRALRASTDIIDTLGRKVITSVLSDFSYTWLPKTQDRCLEWETKFTKLWACNGCPFLNSCCWLYDSYRVCVQWKKGVRAHIGCISNKSRARSLWDWHFLDWYVDAGWEPRIPDGRDIADAIGRSENVEPGKPVPNGNCPVRNYAERITRDRGPDGVAIYRGVAGYSFAFFNRRSDVWDLIYAVFRPSTADGVSQFMVALAKKALPQLRYNTPFWAYTAVARKDDRDRSSSWHLFWMWENPFKIPYVQQDTSV